jgi:hypothetical protein
LLWQSAWHFNRFGKKLKISGLSITRVLDKA